MIVRNLNRPDALGDDRLVGTSIQYQRHDCLVFASTAEQRRGYTGDAGNRSRIARLIKPSFEVRRRQINRNHSRHFTHIIRTIANGNRVGMSPLW